jgi:hypothetical protein
MAYKITKERVIELFDGCEMLEFTVIEMPTKDLLVHAVPVEGKQISVLVRNWDELMSVF